MLDLRCCLRPVIVVVPATTYRHLLAATFELPGYFQRDDFELARQFAKTELDGRAADLQLLQLSRAGPYLLPTRVVIIHDRSSPVKSIDVSPLCTGLHADRLIAIARMLGDAILDQQRMKLSGHEMLPARAGLAKGMDQAVDRYHRRSSIARRR